MVDAARLAAAWQAIAAGGLVGYPTEAVFGLGCDPWNRAAVQRLLALKRRSETKGLIIIAARFAQLRPFVAGIPEPLERQLAQCWPGPYTWLLPARPGLPRWLRGAHRTIAVRVTAHPAAAALCAAGAALPGPAGRHGGALVSTSANAAGRPPCRDVRCVRRLFGGQLDFLVPGRVGASATPTRIIDGLSGRVVRP